MILAGGLILDIVLRLGAARLLAKQRDRPPAVPMPQLDRLGEVVVGAVLIEPRGSGAAPRRRTPLSS